MSEYIDSVSKKGLKSECNALLTCYLCRLVAYRTLDQNDNELADSRQFTFLMRLLPSELSVMQLISVLRIIQNSSPMFRTIYFLSALSFVKAYKPILSLNPSFSTRPLDPISLITLFFDSPEKESMNKTGDMTLLTCLGLFVNPSTMWSEYQTLHPGQGITYYNPQKKITSTIEIQQVNNYLTALAEGRRNCGLVVDLKPSQGNLWWARSASWEWHILRPTILLLLSTIVILTSDLWGAGAISLLLLSQTVTIVWSLLDGRIPSIGNKMEKQDNIFFLANNVTIIVRCQGDLFREASSHVVSKAHGPSVIRSITTLVFLGGVVLAGFAGFEFKIAYLLCHAMQAILFAFASGLRMKGSVTVNRAIWEIDESQTVSVSRRREAYIWACKFAHVGTEWLVDWNLAAGETLDIVEKGLEGTGLVVRKIVNDSE